jgi:hypothetical protein
MGMSVQNRIDTIRRAADTTKVTADTIPVTTDAVSGAADTTPVTADTIPVTTDAVSGAPDTIPGVADTIPGDVDAIPETTDAISGAPDTTPGTADITTGTADSFPGTAEITTGTADALPGTTGSFTEAADALPGTAKALTEAADSIASAPDSIIAEPFSETIYPLISGDTVLGSESISGVSGFLVDYGSTEWHFYFLVSMLIVYAVARAFLGELLNKTFTAASRYNTAVGMYQDNSQLQRKLDSALYIYYFVSIGFFIMLVAHYFEVFPNGLKDFELFGFFTGLLIAIFFIRIVIGNITGHVFYSLKTLRAYLYHGFIYNKLMGILALPMSIAISYTTGILNDIVIWTAIGTMSILLLMKFLRGFIFARKNRILNFYLFLYLCALELVPILLLYKWFTIIV